MVKWEELPVAVDEETERTRALANEWERWWRARYRARTLGFALLGIAGLLAFQGYLSFYMATDATIAWGDYWDGSNQFFQLCMGTVYILFFVLVAVAVGFFKSVTPDLYKGLYLLGLALTVLGVFSPIFFGLLGLGPYAAALLFTSAPYLVGALLVCESFAREDYEGDPRVRRCMRAAWALYGGAALAGAVSMRSANALAGLFIISLWLAAAFAAYLAYLAVHGLGMPWEWGGLPRAGRERIATATAIVVAFIAVSGGLAASQLLRTDLEVIGAVRTGPDTLEITTINNGGWPAHGEIVLSVDVNGTEYELARAGKVEGFGRWIAVAAVNETVQDGQGIVLYVDGEPESRSFVGAGQYPCDVIYPVAAVAVGAVVAGRMRKGRRKGGRAERPPK